MEGNDYDSTDDDVRVSITMTMSAGPANQRRYASSPALPKDGRMVLMTTVSPQMKQIKDLPTQAVGVLAALEASKQHRPPAAGQVASSSAVAVAAEAAAGAPAAATEGVPVAPAVAAPPAAWGAP